MSMLSPIDCLYKNQFSFQHCPEQYSNDPASMSVMMESSLVLCCQLPCDNDKMFVMSLFAMKTAK